MYLKKLLHFRITLVKKLPILTIFVHDSPVKLETKKCKSVRFTCKFNCTTVRSAKLV